jgi:parallel beta-helix repeat protein
VAGSGSNILIQDNEIAYNNTLGFDFGWEAGGLWFSSSTNQVVQGNNVHDNQGLGIHLDYQAYNWLIQGNRTSNNLLAGIDDEIGYDGTARYNIVENEGSYPGKTNPGMWWGCGIYAYASQNVQVYGNTVINSSNGICAISISRGSGNRGTFLVQNLSVHDNVIVQNVGSAAGAVAASGEYMNVYSSSWNNHWSSNTYKLAPSLQLAYVWQGGSSYVSMDANQWRSFGQDTAGTWISPTDSTFPSAKFKANQAVSTVASTQVWSLPTTTSTLVKTEVSVQGTITKVAGPILSGGAWWWNVKFDDGNEGWSEETDLQIF